MGLIRGRACCAVAIAVLGLRAEAIAEAQAIVRISPSIGTTQMYDTNLFSTPSNRQEDFVTRLTPALDVHYGRSTWSLTAREAIDLEKFANHAELSDAFAGQRSLAAVEFRPSSRLTLTAGGDYSRSQNASDLSLGTGLTFTRATAQRTGARASLTHHLSSLTIAHVEYASTRERFTDGPDNRTDSGALGLSRQLASRSTARAEYRLRRFSFGGPSEISHGVGMGLTHNIAPHLSLSIDGGPTVTSGSPAFEGALAMRNRFKAVDVEVAYARTQTTVFGVVGLVAAQSVGATTTWRPNPKLSLTMAPAYYKSERGSLQADVYRVSLGAARPVGRTLSVGITYDTALQRGNLYSPMAEPIRRHQLMVRLVAAAPPPVAR